METFTISGEDLLTLLEHAAKYGVPKGLTALEALASVNMIKTLK